MSDSLASTSLTIGQSSTLTPVVAGSGESGRRHHGACIVVVMVLWNMIGP